MTFFPTLSILAELLTNIRTQVLIHLIRPYTRINLSYLAKELKVDNADVEKLLVQCILDKYVRLPLNE